MKQIFLKHKWHLIVGLIIIFTFTSSTLLYLSGKNLLGRGFNNIQQGGGTDITPIGSNGTILTASSTATNGITWSSAGAGLGEVTYAYGSSTYAKQASTTIWDTAYSWGDHAGLYPTLTYGSSTYLNSSSILAVAKISTSSTSGYVLQSSGNTSTWVATSSLGIIGGSGSPGGNTSNIQFNTAGSFAGENELLWDTTNNYLRISSSTGDTGNYMTLESNYISNTGGLTIAPSGDLTLNPVTGNVVTDANVGIGTSSPSNIFEVWVSSIKQFAINTFGIFLKPLSGIFVGTSTSTQSDSLGLSFGTSTIYKIFPAKPNMASSTNMQISMYEPEGFPSTAVANYSAIYSDDVNRILTFGTAAGSGVLALHDSTLSSATGNAYTLAGPSAAGQYITATTLTGFSTGLIKGAVTTNGYHYVFSQSSSTGSAIYVKRATSSWDNSITGAVKWVNVDLDEAFTPEDTNIGIVGVSGDTLWVASSPTELVPFTISTTTNSLVQGGTVTFASASMSLTNTRVNDNGFYIGFSSTPYVRKYTFDQVLVENRGGHYLAAPATTGPDLFAMKNSIYGILAFGHCGKFFGF